MSSENEMLKSIPYATLSPIPILPQLSVALCLLCFVFGITYIGTTDTKAEQSKQVLDIRVEKVPTHQEESMQKKNAFEGVILQAKSAIVWDVVEQKVIFNKNADDPLPLASITKLMTALVAYELLDPDEKVSITTSSLGTEGDSGLIDGERFTLENLTDLTLVTSSNDGATAIGAKAGRTIDADANAEAIFVEAMNVKAEELGLTKTYFKNSTGLDVSATEASAYGSARDVAHLMEYVVTHITDAVALTALDLAKVKNTDGAYHTAKNTNTYVSDIDGLIASKTGYTSLAKGNLVLAVNMGLNRPVVVVVLGSSYEGRFLDAMELINRARAHVAGDQKAET